MFTSADNNSYITKLFSDTNKIDAVNSYTDNLKFDLYNLYYHSWINFKYKGIEYVFDPCLQILCRKTYYDKIFEVQVKGKVTAKQVKEYLLNKKYSGGFTKWINS